MEENSVVKFSIMAVVVIVLVASLMLPIISDITTEWVQAII